MLKGACLVTCKFDKYLIKGDWEKLRDIIFFTAQRHITPKWLVRYDRNSNLSKILCLSSLSVNLMETEFIVHVTEKLHSEKSDPAQIQTHSSFCACPCYLQVWQISEQRWLRKAGDIIFFHRWKTCNTKVTGQIWPEFKPIQDFMPVLVTCKFDDEWILRKSGDIIFSIIKLETSFIFTAQGHVTPKWLVRYNRNSKVRDFMPVPFTCKFDELNS